MASLFRRLQAQSIHPHRPQQLLLLHEYKKPELQTGPLGPGAFPISFLN